MNLARKRYVEEMYLWYWQGGKMRHDERFLRSIECRAGIQEQDVVDWRNLVSYQIVQGRNMTIIDRCLGEFFTQEQGA